MDTAEKVAKLKSLYAVYLMRENILATRHGITVYYGPLKNYMKEINAGNYTNLDAAISTARLLLSIAHRLMEEERVAAD